MIQFLFEENIITYIYIGIGIFGLLIRIMLELMYRRLAKESDNVGGTKNKTIKLIKMKFETCYKLKIGVNNVDTFVDKSIIKNKFCGILLSTWENISGQALLLLLLILPIATIYGIINKCGQELLLNGGAVGLVAISVLIFVDKSIAINTKKYTIRLNLNDYFNNFLKARMENETTNPELIERYRREYFQTVDAGSQTIAAAAAPVIKEGPRDEINRRREARLRKEEERRLNAIKREEELRKIEEARREEEARRLEEKALLARKRREERLLKLHEERDAFEARQRGERKKNEEELPAADSDKIKPESIKPEKVKDDQLTIDKENINKANINKANINKANINKVNVESSPRDKATNSDNSDNRQIVSKPGDKGAEIDIKKYTTEQEEKLIEDVLKEFFGLA